MKDTEISRSDGEYASIDEFEKYEFTHNITYELARRNMYVIKSLSLLSEVFGHYKQTILPILIKYEKETITDDTIEAINADVNMLRKFFIGLVNHYDKKQFIGDFESLTFKNLKEKFSYLVNTLAKELYDKYYIIYQYESEKLTTDFDEIYDPSIYLERDKELTKHIHNLVDEGINLRSDYKHNFKQNQYFTVCQDVNKEQKGFAFSVIYPNFKTPMRDFADTKILLNLSFSKDEILDYIEKIKDEYDKKNPIIKTPRELLEEDLNNLDSDLDVFGTQKWADILFIYDCFLYNHQVYPDKEDREIKKEIQLELTKFHGVKMLKQDDEIKRKKDTKYKLIPWNEYEKLPEYNAEDESIGTLDNEKAYLSIKAIEYKYDKIKDYIEGDNPKYKTLINKSAI